MTRKWKVLLVDDEVSVARALKLGLDAGGDFHVRIETDGERALDTIRKFRPDVVLLDVVMPGMRGDEVLRRIRADDQLRDTPVLFLTATSPESASVSEYPDEWIGKPVLAAEVARQIRTLLPRAAG